MKFGWDPTPGQFNANFRNETQAPYALFGDQNNGADYLAGHDRQGQSYAQGSGLQRRRRGRHGAGIAHAPLHRGVSGPRRPRHREATGGRRPEKVAAASLALRGFRRFVIRESRVIVSDRCAAAPPALHPRRAAGCHRDHRPVDLDPAPHARQGPRVRPPRPMSLQPPPGRHGVPLLRDEAQRPGPAGLPPDQTEAVQQHDLQQHRAALRGVRLALHGRVPRHAAGVLLSERKRLAEHVQHADQPLAPRPAGRRQPRAQRLRRLRDAARNASARRSRRLREPALNLSLPKLTRFKNKAVLADLNALPARGYKHRVGLNALYGDGSGRWVDRKLFDASLRPCTSINASFDSNQDAIWSAMDR